MDNSRKDWVEYGKFATLREVQSFHANPEARQMAYDMGVIPMRELKNGVWYRGSCRNATEALWVGDEQHFRYLRTKFGNTFWETILPLERDNGFDLFFPIEEIVGKE